MPLEETPEVRPLLKTIEVHRLYGMYDYELELGGEDPRAPVSILYGDNGCGKTTLLRLVHRLLSPEMDRGHRTFVREVPFKHLSVDLYPNVRVRVDRESEDDDDGPIIVTIFRDGRKVVACRYADREPDAARMRASENEGNNELLTSELSRIGFNVVFLSDDRRSADDRPAARRFRHRLDFEGVERVEFGDSREELLPVEVAIQEAEALIRRKAMKATGRGATSANRIITEVVEGLSSIDFNTDRMPTPPAELLALLNTVSVSTSSFAQYGLLADFDADRLRRVLAKARPDSYSTIERILKPHLDGIRVRLEALRPTYELLSTIVGRLNNTFMRNKRVSYSLVRGFTVRNAYGPAIELKQLSSGEKQILLLLATVVLSQLRPTLFLIDEPELSLNVKWQRELVAAMLDCMAGSQSQLVLATHSHELITRYRSQVVRLGSATA